MRWRSVALASMVLVLLVSTALANAAERVRSASRTRATLIAFQSYGDVSRPRRDGIWLMRSDGTGLTRLRNQPVGSVDPRWSPDGRRLAFAALTDSGMAIYVIGVAGRGLTRVAMSTSARDVLFYPSWSRDGAHLLVEGGNLCRHSLDTICNSRLYVLDLHTRRKRVVTGTANAAYGGSWSPDGRTILFSRSTGLGAALASVAAAGGHRQDLTKGLGAFDTWGRWRPDGKAILFTRMEDGPSVLHMLNADGTGDRRLRLSTKDNGWGTWSPDGRRIAYIVGGGKSGDIFDATLPGLGVGRLTATAFDESAPDWQPHLTR